MPSLGLLYGVELIHRGQAAPTPAPDGLPLFGDGLVLLQHGSYGSAVLQHAALGLTVLQSAARGHLSLEHAGKGEATVQDAAQGETELGG